MESPARSTENRLLTVKRRWSVNFALMTWANCPAVGTPLSMTCAGTGAWISVSQSSHTHFPRTWRSTVNTPGVESRFSVTSSPMRLSAQPHRQCGVVRFVMDQRAWKFCRQRGALGLLLFLGRRRGCLQRLEAHLQSPRYRYRSGRRASWPAADSTARCAWQTSSA